MSKCNFFKEEITYLAHRVSKDGMCNPVTQTWRPLSLSVCCLRPTQRCSAFLGLVGHYRRFIKGFTCIAQPLNEHLTGEGASRKSEWVSLSEDALRAFEVLKQPCMTAPVLAFTDYTKPFLLGDWCVSRTGLGVVLCQKQADRQYHPVCLQQQNPYASWEELPFN